MLEQYCTASREIGIDMGHRVTNHGSKCKNVHGHRYRVIATISGQLVESGEQEGMVMDFGFVKDLMMQVIDDPCDHGLCLWVKDPLVSLLVGPAWKQTKALLSESTYVLVRDVPLVGKLYILNDVPTAENLARHWFNRLYTAISEDPRNVRRSTSREDVGAQCYLKSITVWETPNCYVVFPQ